MSPWLIENGRQPKVVVLAPPDKPRVSTELLRLEKVLKKFSDILAIDQGFQYSFDDSDADLVVVLGGDGSILQAARQMGRKQRPILGVNVGKLGFLAAISPDRFLDIWPEVCAGQYIVTKHLMFECEVYRDGELIHQQIGLNETSILGGPPYSMLQIDLYIDQFHATTYSCDGLIISTPVGSTAHNLSAGGPILRKNLQAFVVCPISPHTLTMRPVVDTADRVFELQLVSDHPTASVVVDGRVVCQLDRQHRVRVFRSDALFELVTVPGQNDFLTLREKLGWNGSPTGRQNLD